MAQKVLWRMPLGPLNWLLNQASEPGPVSAGFSAALQPVPGAAHLAGWPCKKEILFFLFPPSPPASASALFLCVACAPNPPGEFIQQ